MNKTDAQKVFDEREERARELLQILGLQISRMEQKFLDEGSRNWGYVGSLGNVVEKLEDLSAFLGQ